MITTKTTLNGDKVIMYGNYDAEKYLLSVKNSEHEFTCTITRIQAKDTMVLGIYAYPTIYVKIIDDFEKSNKPFRISEFVVEIKQIK